MRALRLPLVIAIGAAVTMAAGWVVRAQQTGAGQDQDKDQSSPAASTPANSPVIQIPPPPQAQPPTPSNEAAPGDEETPPVAKPQPKPEAAAKPPPVPVLPVRGPAAILQALDKVTAETIRFAAPVGQRIRYKNLVFTVKACETTGLADPAPQASAYLTIESRPMAVEGGGPPPAKVVYRGWMFANSPGLHPLEHPVYDAWLIACMASAPPT